MNVGEPLSIVIPTPAQSAQKQSSLGVRDEGVVGTQHYGPHLSKADLFTSIDEWSVNKQQEPTLSDTASQYGIISEGTSHPVELQ